MGFPHLRNKRSGSRNDMRRNDSQGSPPPTPDLALKQRRIFESIKLEIIKSEVEEESYSRSNYSGLGNRGQGGSPELRKGGGAVTEGHAEKKKKKLKDGDKKDTAKLSISHMSEGEFKEMCR